MTSETLLEKTSHKLADGRHLAPRRRLAAAADTVYAAHAVAAGVPCQPAFHTTGLFISLSTD